MIVETYAGLCNRLRVLLSYRARYGPIDVIWPRDPEVQLQRGDQGDATDRRMVDMKRALVCGAGGGWCWRRAGT